jgi:hypothetical protein
LHQWLGHLNTGAVCDLARKFATGIEIDKEHDGNCNCLACIEGKQHKQPFKMGWTQARRIGELLHMDLVGPMETMSLDMKQYFLIIVDDYSHAD